MKKRRRMSRFWATLCIMCMMLLGGSLVVSADTEVSGSYSNFSWVYNVDSKTLTFSGSGELNIPSGYLPRSDAEIIVIPAGCTSLTSSTLLEFENSQVKEYRVDSENANYATEDGVLYTNDKKTLLAYPSKKTSTSFTIPDTVVEIEENAFREVSGLKNVTLSSNLQTIGCNAFYDTGITSVTIPSSVYRIYNQAFANCSSLVSIQVEKGNGIYYENNGVLYSRMGIYDVDTQKEREICTLKCYPAGKSAASFSVPSGVTEIGMNAFQGANNLQTIELPTTVTRLSGQAFAGTEKLVKIYIPSSVTDIVGVNGTGEDCGIRGKANAVIYGKSGSTAQRYAENNNIIFVPTEDTVENDISTKPTTPALTKAIGQKALKISASSLPLQLKKSTTVLKVTKKATGDSVVKWTSSKPSVVYVNSKTGKLTAKKVGKATITVNMKSGATLKCTVTVQRKAVKMKKLTLSKTKATLKKGQSYTIKVTKNPLTSLEKISFRSSNKKVATVSSNGKITAKKKGTATITVKASGGAKKTCKITVK